MPDAAGSNSNRRQGESGQALLELALVAPILILLVMAIFQFAFVIETQMGLTNAVREAARRAAAISGPDAAWVRKELCGSNILACETGLLKENVQGFNAARLTEPDIQFVCYRVAGVDNYRVEVTVDYAHPVFFGLIAFATDAIDGTDDGNWDISVSADMRLERGMPPVVTQAC